MEIKNLRYEFKLAAIRFILMGIFGISAEVIATQFSGIMYAAIDNINNSRFFLSGNFEGVIGESSFFAIVLYFYIHNIWPH